MTEEMRVTVIATGFGKAEEKPVSAPVASRFTRVAPITFGIKESSRDKKENRDIPAFVRRVKATERYDEVKLDESNDFSLEDEDRFDIPTFLRKQAD
jgi:hypothetical protein